MAMNRFDVYPVKLDLAIGSEIWRGTWWNKGMVTELSSEIAGSGRTHVLRDPETQSEEEAMKYFTPDLIERFGSSDPATADMAHAEWEETGDRYEASLKAIESQLPAGIRQIHDRYYLHDAVVVGMGQQDGRFVLLLQLDTPPRDLLLFTYDLVAQPVILPEALPREYRCPTRVEWMYDEIELVPGEPLTVVQSILFSNGWEVQLSFHDVQVQQLQPVLPLLGPLLPASLPQSA
jgi:hypothetical protein